MGPQKRRALHVNYGIAQTQPISKRDNGQMTVEPKFNGDDLRDVELKVFGVSVTPNISLRSVHPRSWHTNASAMLALAVPLVAWRGTDDHPVLFRKRKQQTKFGLAAAQT